MVAVVCYCACAACGREVFSRGCARGANSVTDVGEGGHIDSWW